jgi:branched-chain amino acid transport system substrate-binding protein
MKTSIVIFPVILITGLFTTNLFAQETLKLSIPLPLTGTLARFGEIEKRSYEFAMGEINAAGGIRGKRIVLEFQDSQGKPACSKAIAERLIDEKKQPVIFGEYSSSCSKVLAALAEERKFPCMVVTGASDDITQQNYKYVFRMNPANAYYPSGLISFLKEVVNPVTIAILHESSEFGTSGGEAMFKQAQKAGIKVLLKEQYDREAVDFTPALSKLRASKPDVIYMVSYAMDAVLLMRKIKALRIDARLYAGSAAGFAIPEFIQCAKETAEYVVTTTPWSPRVAYPKAQEFAEKYKTHFKDYPSYHGAEAYSALYVIKDSLERAKTWTPDDIRDAMKATNTMTAFGPVKFENKEGYTNQNFMDMDTLVMQVINGRRETIWPENYATKKYIYPTPSWRDRK